jgi:hypothetical protein
MNRVLQALGLLTVRWDLAWITLKMKIECSFNRRRTFTRLHGGRHNTILLFTAIAVRTSNLTYCHVLRVTLDEGLDWRLDLLTAYRS